MSLFSEIRNIMEGKGGDPILSFILLILSWFYGIGHRCRLSLYKIGILKVKILPIPVISIGNLTVGGTGKTPAIIEIANILKDMGIKVAILSRGYKGRARGEINAVSDGDRILMKPEQSGDEPYMLALRLKGVPVITGTDRYTIGRYAIEKFGADILLLDDGYQHIQLKRKLNILLIDSSSPFGNGYLLPRGILREPPSYINRADIILLTKAHTNQGPIPDLTDSQLKQLLKRDIPLCKSHYINEDFIDLKSKKTIALDEARGKRGFAFCGIASPESFKNSLKRAGIDITGFVCFEDHYQFSMVDINNLIEKAMKTGSEVLITTEKDAVRLMDFKTELFSINSVNQMQVWFLKIRMEVFKGYEILLSKIRGAVLKQK